MKLSDNAIGALMLALQKSLMEQSDIVPLLQQMNFELLEGGNGELVVTNAPVISLEQVEVHDELAQLSIEE
mgnify:CR=1 FL=1